ncbi:PaaI family thioesterase [Siccirubricoccus deserti]
MPHAIHPEAVPEGFVPATHGGPYAKGLGPFWVKRGDQRVSVGLRLQHTHCNSAGGAHGGFVATLADLGLIHAASVMRERDGLPRHHLTTVTLTVDYVAPAKEGAGLRSRRRSPPRPQPLLHRGRGAGRWQARGPGQCGDRSAGAAGLIIRRSPPAPSPRRE